MTRPGVISGRVLDSDGRPVAGARVFFARGPGPLPDVAAVTGDDGAFALSAPHAGTYHVQSVTDADQVRVVEVHLDAGEHVSLDIAP